MMTASHADAEPYDLVRQLKTPHDYVVVHAVKCSAEVKQRRITVVRLVRSVVYLTPVKGGGYIIILSYLQA